MGRLVFKWVQSFLQGDKMKLYAIGRQSLLNTDNSAYVGTYGKTRSSICIDENDKIYTDYSEVKSDFMKLTRKLELIINKEGTGAYPDQRGMCWAGEMDEPPLVIKIIEFDVKEK